MSEITYFPPATQRQLAANRARLADKPYGRFFDPRMMIGAEGRAALAAPLDPSQALRERDANRLLEPGYLDGETGYCLLPDGGGYVASLVAFPGVKLAAMRWWWWWHSVESERYALWHPWAHVSVERRDRDVLARPGLDDEARYVGSRHKITEYIGARRMKIFIDFQEPSAFGLDAARIRQAGIVHGCGWVRLQHPALRVARMIHLARETADGFELRSRYWLARDVALQTPLGWLTLRQGGRLAMRAAAGWMAGLAYDQLVHDQSEFTHLAGILGGLYAEFGPG